MINLERVGEHEFVASNGRGASVRIGRKGQEGSFSPVELLVAGRLADRERAAEAPTTKTWRVISVVVSVLVVLLAVGTTVQTVRTGHSGSEAVWSGVGS